MDRAGIYHTAIAKGTHHKGPRQAGNKSLISFRAGHGLYAWGQNLSEARRHLEILEFLLEQRWRQLLLEVLVVRGHGSAPDTEGPRELGR
jgi:ribulose-5-phosphate 4-epimerase/fuculose-1-phosphate aldolase